MRERAKKTSLVEETLLAWQLRAKRRLTYEDGREIAANLTGFMGVLRTWAANELDEASTTATDQQGIPAVSALPQEPTNRRSA